MQWQIGTYYDVSNKTVLIPKNSQLKFTHEQFRVLTRAPPTSFIKVTLFCGTSIKLVG
jgi:hypothetical protein